MLAHANRITSGSDYKAVVRRGSRSAGPNLVAYVKKNATPEPARFGFIVAKNIGDAVRRNRVRRRLKAASYELLPLVSPGTDVVVRALPTAEAASWPELRAELALALAKGERGR